MPAALAFCIAGTIRLIAIPWPRMITLACWEIAWLIPAVHWVGVPWLVYSTHLAPYFLATCAAAWSTLTTYGTALDTGMSKITLPLIFDMSNDGALSLNAGIAEAAAICFLA